jgi:DNA-binding CsgD family transcriptional regulator
MSDPNSASVDLANEMMGETVVDPTVWPKVMDAICEAIGATGAVLFQTDIRTLDAPRTDSFDDMIRSYFAEGWHTRDIRAERAVPLLMKGTRVFIDEDILTRDELESSEYISECTLPKGFKWAAGVAFSAGPAMWALCLHRTFREQPFDRFEAGMLEALCDRMTEVATLSTAVGRIALTAASNALDAVSKPAIAIDRFGLVLAANREAEVTFDDDFRIRNRRLFARDPQAQSKLHALADRLLIAPEMEPLIAAPIVVRRNGRGPLVLRVLPVHSAARNPFLGARALLVVSDLAAKRTVDPQLIANVFGLTSAEARLAAAFAGGCALEDIAEQRAISLTTARNQLKAVFAKTDTHRQSELVALLARL